MNEAGLVKKIVGMCKTRGALATKIVGSGWQRRGISDLLICYRGIFIACEVKQPHRKKHHNGGCSDPQLKYLADVKRAKGIAIVAYEVADVKRVLDGIDDALQRAYERKRAQAPVRPRRRSR